MNQKGVFIIPVIIIVSLFLLLVFVSIKFNLTDLNSIITKAPKTTDYINSEFDYTDSLERNTGSGGSTGCNDFKKPPYKDLDEWESDASPEVIKFFEKDSQDYIEEKLAPHLVGYGGGKYSKIEKRMKTYAGYDNDCKVHHYHYYLGYRATELEGNSESYSNKADSYSIYFAYDPRIDEWDIFKINMQANQGYPARNLITEEAFSDSARLAKDGDLFTDAISNNSELFHLYWKQNNESDNNDDTVILIYRSSVLGSSKPCEGYYYQYIFEVDNFSNKLVDETKTKENVICLSN